MVTRVVRTPCPLDWKFAWNVTRGQVGARVHEEWSRSVRCKLDASDFNRAHLEEYEDGPNDLCRPGRNAVQGPRAQG